MGCGAGESTSARLRLLGMGTPVWSEGSVPSGFLLSTGRPRIAVPACPTFQV
jgi:hypothetical protein